MLAAQKGLTERLGRIETYSAKAKAIAAVLAKFPQIEVMPNPPQTNMMHVFLRGEYDTLRSSALEIAQETGTWLFSWLAPTAIPGYQKFELSVGDAALDLSEEEIEGLFQKLFEKAETSFS